ncbi:MAG: hypothetical protein E4H14_08990 [Candidatus Thorarchaeota archaeon]|nr:MAG: hypothetical protein E4H14_08990 [Candidatus Thorarchaeota archaeon]
MAKYETRVQVWFYSEGASPSEVVKKLMALGFQPVKGAYDFVYMHSEKEMTDTNLGAAILEISDALHKTLSGFRVLYTLDTHISEEDADLLRLDVIDAELAQTRKELEEIGE